MGGLTALCLPLHGHEVMWSCGNLNTYYNVICSALRANFSKGLFSALVYQRSW